MPRVGELKEWLTSQDLATGLGISREAVRKRLESGTLVLDKNRAVKTRLGWLVHPGELDRLVSLRAGKSAEKIADEADAGRMAREMSAEKIADEAKREE